MLLFKRFLNWFAVAGYAKAAAALSRQGYHDEAKALLLAKLELQGRKERALI